MLDRDKFPRLCELYDLSPGDSPFRGYLSEKAQTVAHQTWKEAFFEEQESFLRPLDENAWGYFKQRMEGYLKKKNRCRGWQQFLEAINETKGYGHLVSIGCGTVAFIKESTANGQKTPDLKGTLGGRTILCEVKTINVSDNEAKDRLSGRPVLRDGVSAPFSRELKNKITEKLQEAKSQLNAYLLRDAPRKIVYLVVYVDDDPHNENEHQHSQELDNYLAECVFTGLEIGYAFARSYYSPV